MADYTIIKTWVSKNGVRDNSVIGLLCTGDVSYPCPLPKINYACFSGLMPVYFINGTMRAISRIFINNYHPPIISLFLGMLYIRATRFVKNVVSFGTYSALKSGLPLQHQPPYTHTHTHYWTSEVEVLWMNLPRITLHHVWLSKWFSLSYPQPVTSNYIGLMILTGRGPITLHPI